MYYITQSTDDDSQPRIIRELRCLVPFGLVPNVRSHRVVHVDY